MDFDLFDDGDDDLLTSVIIEPESQCMQTQSTNTVLPELCCCGKDSQNVPLADDGFVRSGFINGATLHNGEIFNIAISNYAFTASHMHSSLNLEFLFGDACKHIQYLFTHVHCGSGLPGYGNIKCGAELSNYQRRRQVTIFLLLLLHTTQAEDWTLISAKLNSFRVLLNRISEADTWRLIHFANSTEGNECNIAAYHLLHGLLEWKFLDLCLLQKYELSHTVRDDSKDNEYDEKAPCAFRSQLERILDDLLVCSLYLYTKNRSTDLLLNSPFSCVCIKEIWLLMQLVLEKWNVPNELETLNFWKLFNDVVNKRRNENDIFTLTPLAYCEFSNWLMNALTCLYGYRENGHFERPLCIRMTISHAIENYSFCESSTQQFLQHQPNEEQLRVYLCLLMPTLLQWWKPSVTIPTLLWEYFHKRLNSSFYIAGEAPANLAIACSSGRSYVDRYRTLLLNTKPELKLSSFTLFVLVMGKSIDRLLQAQSSHQVLKLLSRIFTKFSLQKFLALNETGIHHLIELFLVLLLCGDFSELAPKLKEQLLSIKLDKITSTRQIAVTKGHVAILLMHAERRCNMSDYITKLMKQLLDIRNDLAVSKMIADSLLDIFVLGDNFARGEHLLIDSWLTNFLSNCTPCEQERTFEALHTIFLKVQTHEISVDVGGEVINALSLHILPFLKQQYATSYSSWMSQLAADFCIRSTLLSDAQSFKRLFMYFTETQTANRQCVPQFLLRVLESDRGSMIEPSVIMHVWLKSLVLLSAINEDVVKLTRQIVKLPVFKYMTNLDANEVVQAKEPLCVFVAAVGKQYDSCDNYDRRCKITDNFNAYIYNFDRWLQPSCASNSGKTTITNSKSEKNDVTFRFYSFLAIVIYNCPQIVYVKSKITCFFHVAITRFVLPTNVQMGKQPEAKLVQIVHKIWPVLMQGIGRLNYKTDPYIGKTLNDLIQKWTPHFKISSDSKVVARPFIICVRGDNHELSLVMFERMTSLFLTTQRRNMDPNACLVITIFQEIIKAIIMDTYTTNTSEHRLETLMKGSCFMMLEHIMMVDDVVPSRVLLYEFFKLLINCTVYRDSLRLKELLAEHLRLITKKHLAYYTFFYFDLITKLAQISPELVESIMDFLLTEIQVVEQKRGAGEDNRIRTCLRKLQDTIALSSTS